jgi:hypothetical protein
MIKEGIMLQHTAHSALRTAQRGLSKKEIDYVYIHGSRHHCGGALIYYLKKQDVPLSDSGKDWAERLVGTALVVDSEDQVLLTAWRNRNGGLKLIRKKAAYQKNGKFWKNQVFI